MAKKEIRIIVDSKLWLSFLLTPGTSKIDKVISDPGVKLLAKN
jgi:hypothetical protein